MKGRSLCGCLFILCCELSYNLFAMKHKRPRINRESNTVAAMIHLYCHKHHSRAGLCPKCTVLLDYARKRLDKCPFQEGKPTCAKCPVHCYSPNMRDSIRTIMRYSGRRMLYRHPIAAIQHLLDTCLIKEGKSLFVGLTRKWNRQTLRMCRWGHNKMECATWRELL